MRPLTLSLPINNLSFGNVSVNILREIYKRGDIDVVLFPKGNKIELDAFDRLDKEFVAWLVQKANERLNRFKREAPSLKLWHINGAEEKYSDQQYLFSFYELNNPTIAELNIVNNQSLTIFSSSVARDVFNSSLGFDVSVSVPLGFDTDFYLTNKRYYPSDVIHFGLMGKWEKRKHTEKIIKLWLKKYGNNTKYRLTCCVYNPFYKPEQMNAVVGNAIEGKRYSNINFLNYLKTNSEVNEFLNSIDIDLSGLSGAEGWGLPAFNATALGKWSIVLNATGHTDWANSENSILVQPNGLMPAYDGIFFHPNQPFNQGDIYTWSDEEVIQAFERAESLAKTKNENGIKLQTDFSYAKTVDKLLSFIK